jgi:hypothetical protein
LRVYASAAGRVEEEELELGELPEKIVAHNWTRTVTVTLSSVHSRQQNAEVGIRSR